jgi:ABC-type branched-subunit amino acid transport system ATPase component
MTTVLEINGLHKQFGGIVVAGDVNLTVQKGEVVGLIGPNGAGEDWLFNIVSGLSREWRDPLNGRSIERLPMHKRTRLGLSRVAKCTAFPDSQCARQLDHRSAPLSGGINPPCSVHSKDAARGAKGISEH